MLKDNKKLVFSLTPLLVLLLTGWFLYSCFGHKFIRAMYYGESFWFLNGVIEAPRLYPLERYYAMGDVICQQALFVSAYVYLFLCMIFYFLRAAQASGQGGLADIDGSAAPMIPGRRSIATVGGVDLIFFLFLILVVIKYTYSIEMIMDISLWDETYYLQRGIKLPIKGLPHAQWAPLYAVWYFVLSFFNKDYVQLYYMNFKILVSSTTLLLYIYLRRLYVTPFISALASFLFLMSGVFRWDNTWVTLYALSIFLLFLILATFTSSKENYYYILGLGILTVSFVRPEYFVSLLLLGALALFWYLRALVKISGKPRLHLSKIFSFVLIGVVMIAIFGNPLREPKPYEPICVTGDHTTIAKSWLSFAQHFSINFLQRHHSPVDPWEVWEGITKSAFGNANTVVAAMVNNPKEFLRHVSYNVYRYAPTLMQLLLIKPNPSCWRPLDTAMRSFYILFLGALGICLAVTRRNTARTADYILLKRLGVILLLVSAASMLSAFVVYPREHYLILQLMTIIVLIAYFTSHVFNENVSLQRPGAVKALVTGLCMVLLTPYPIVEYPSGIGYSFGLMPKKITTQRMNDSWQRNLKTVEFLKSLRIRDSVNLLTAEGKFDIYVGDNYTSLMGVGTNESFTAFIKQHDVNMVLASGLLNESIRFDAREYREFFDNPHAAGFIKLEVPFTKRSLFLRRELFSGAHGMESR